MLINKRTAILSTIVVSLLIIIVFAITVMFAQTKDSLQFYDAWIPLAPPKAKIMAGYLTIENPTRNTIEILDVSSPDFANVMIHETIIKDGISHMKMRDKLLLSPGEEVVFERGGLHLMLMYKKRVFKEGDTVKLNFSTSKGLISISALVKIAVVDNH